MVTVMLETNDYFGVVVVVVDPSYLFDPLWASSPCMSGGSVFQSVCKS